jgi:hypothetical protein
VASLRAQPAEDQRRVDVCLQRGSPLAFGDWRGEGPALSRGVGSIRRDEGVYRLKNTVLPDLEVRAGQVPHHSSALVLNDRVYEHGRGVSAELRLRPGYGSRDRSKKKENKAASGHAHSRPGECSDANSNGLPDKATVGG